MRDRLEQTQVTVDQQNFMTDQAKPREALLLAKVESLPGRLSKIENMLLPMVVSMKEHKRRLDAHETVTAE